MRKITLFSFSWMLVLFTSGQTLQTDNLLALAKLPKNKLDNYLLKKGYYFQEKELLNDTVLSKYKYRQIKNLKKKITDSTVHNVVRADAKNTYAVAYQTSSATEFQELVNEFKNTGFYCNDVTDSLLYKPFLFQYKQTTVRTSCTVSDSIKIYCLQVQQKMLPDPKNMFYADDLLAFSSHECLAYYFGKENVKKDIYYFSDNELARCSVLYFNTKRQVVFIWQDEVNKCTIERLIFGGQQRLEGAKETNDFIAENNWVFRSGLKAGMSLFELRKLNGNDFKFYGGKSSYSGMVMPDSNGKVNFKKENVLLSCINCRDDKFSSVPFMNADEALAEERILFILSIILSPEQENPSL